MFVLLTIIHVLICVLLVLAVLLQSSKGGGLAAALGGSGASSLLGGRSAATFLSRATSILAAAFMISCLTQAVAVRARHAEPVTATERMLREQGVPAAPIPISGGVLPGEDPGAAVPGAGQSEAAAEVGGQPADAQSAPAESQP
jgi:preprotein translocase subunit SecG